jgi:hypothetical protein
LHLSGSRVEVIFGQQRILHPALSVLCRGRDRGPQEGKQGGMMRVLQRGGRAPQARRRPHMGQGGLCPCGGPPTTFPSSTTFLNSSRYLSILHHPTLDRFLQNPDLVAYTQAQRLQISFPAWPLTTIMRTSMTDLLETISHIPLAQLPKPALHSHLQSSTQLIYAAQGPHTACYSTCKLCGLSICIKFSSQAGALLAALWYE